LNVLQWLRYGPWLAQVVVTRRRNLKWGYCTEYDRTSDPVPYDELALRMLITNGWRLTRDLIDALDRTVRACQERDAVVGWTLTGSNQADVGSISLRSGTW
jgi:hypothetical protein